MVTITASLAEFKHPPQGACSLVSNYVFLVSTSYLIAEKQPKASNWVGPTKISPNSAAADDMLIPGGPVSHFKTSLQPLVLSRSRSFIPSKISSAYYRGAELPAEEETCCSNPVAAASGLAS